MSDDDFMCMDSSGEEEDVGLDFEEEDIGFSAEEEEEAGHTSMASKPKNSYQILTMDMISKKMFEIIHEVNAVFHLPTPHVRLLLISAKWDKEKLLERYYTGDQEALFREAHLVHPCRSTRRQPSSEPKALSTATCGAAASPGKEYICDICLLAFPPSVSRQSLLSRAPIQGLMPTSHAPGVCSSQEMTGLECGHLFCRECWDSYLNVMIVCVGRGQTIECPDTSCPIVVDEATVLKLLRKPDVKQKYQMIITNSFVQDHPDLKWCPSPGCTNAVLATSVDHSPVTCSCGHDFCFHCSHDPHEPILCGYLKLWAKKCDDDSETSNWIHVNTKECPHCHATIEKNGGCNHMICSTCKSEFCWVCLGPWEPHGSSWYHCNRFNEHDAKAARDAQAKSRAALERYLFYCNRYMNHLKSSKIEHKLYEMAHAKMQELQQLSMSWIEAQFLKRAVDILCQCRQTLMYTYAFAFYLNQNNHTLIFEDNQRDLEMATEKLSEYLERDITKDSVANMKIFVQDKTKYCEARRQVLLDHVYEGYDQDFWDYNEDL